MPDALGDLERFLHAVDDVPALIKVGLAHAQFETIHPFLDGNGRVGRLLITFLLTERHILQQPVLYISHYFAAHRQSYYDHLQAVRDHGDWESWLLFFLKGVAEVSAEAADTARRILRLREDHRKAVTDNLGRAAGNGHRVLEHLYEKPMTSVSDIRQLTGTTYPAANQLVARMVDCGVLREITGRDAKPCVRLPELHRPVRTLGTGDRSLTTPHPYPDYMPSGVEWLGEKPTN